MNARNARAWPANACVYLLAWRVYLPVNAAKVDAAISANLKEFGYGG
ncbi:MAG: hypothetical protein ABSF77_17190 [Spirochaetia bacterium]|jgi:hypothetical protein